MNFISNKKAAFTLAEVVVVMAILGVMMAAFAPVVTKRTITAGGNNKITFDIMKEHNGIYYGTTGDSKIVAIGDTAINSTEISPKLYINARTYSTTTMKTITPQLAFSTDENTAPIGQLIANKSSSESDGSLVLGGKFNSTSGALNYNIDKLKNAVVVGMNACANLDEQTTTFQNIVCIGANAGNVLPENLKDNRIYIGSGSIYASDIYFGDHDLDMILHESGYAKETAPSDIRLKNVGKEFKGGLDELKQLTFYNYTYKRDADKTPRVGVMAQDLQKVFPNAVSENKDGYLYIRKDDMFYAALNSIKDLLKKVTDNSAKIKVLEERNAVLEKQIKELQDLYIDLANKVDKKAAKKKLTITPEIVEAEEVPAEPAQEP